MWHQNGDGTETRIFRRNGMWYFGCVRRWNYTKEIVGIISHGPQSEG